MKIIEVVLVALIAGLLSGCGGGSGSNSSATPAGTPVSLATMKGLFTGTAASGTQISFAFSGSDNVWNWNGTQTLVSYGQTVFEGQNVTVSSTVTATTPSTNVYASRYYLMNGSPYKYTTTRTDSPIVFSGIPSSQAQFPATANVGDSGNLWTFSNSDGTTTENSWKLDPELNGNSKFILSSINKDTTNSVLTVGEITYYLDNNGSPFRIVIKSTSSNGTTISLSGNKNCIFRPKPTVIPTGWRPAIRFDGDRHSGRKPTAVPEQSDRLFVM